VVKGPVTLSWIFGCLIQVEWRNGPGSGAAQKLIELCFSRKPLIPKSFRGRRCLIELSG
jgi:hypothetical protein